MATIGLIVVALVAIGFTISGVCYILMAMFTSRASGPIQDVVGLSLLGLCFLAIGLYCGNCVLNHLSIHILP